MKKQNLLLIPLTTALLIVLTLITPPISIGGVPFSLQPFFIAIIALLFDWKTTLSIVALYILIGFLGLPVFTGGKNGIAALASGTSGFIFGFLPYGLFLSFTHSIKKTSFRNNVLYFFIIPLISLLTLYVCGFLSMNLTFHWSIIKFTSALGLFFITDLIKLILAFSIVSSLKPITKHLI